MSAPPITRGAALLGVARHALIEAIGGNAPPAPQLADALADDRLSAPGASFVTLKRAGELRGCIGTLEAHQPLIDDVRANARAAALADRRFAVVAADELEEISIEVSVLSPLEEVELTGEEELLAALTPFSDGVVIACGERRATFLPQVWDSLPEPARFWHQLKLKAGLPEEFWSADLRVWRYSVEKFEE